MWPGSRPTSIPSGILIHAAVWPQYTWAEYLGFCLLFGEGELVLHLTNVAGSRPTSLPSSTLIRPAVWAQWTWAENWGLCRKGSWVPSNTMSLRSRPTFLPSGILIHRAIWPQQIWAENGGLCLFGGGGPGGQDETYLHAKFHLGSSNRLATIHQRHRQDMTDRQTTVR